MFKIILNRTGVAMIELIFAIVIMGIVLLSAPMLINQAAKAGLFSVQQEAIVAGATEMGMIFTRHWDEQDTNESRYSPILVTAEAIAALNEANDASGDPTGRRIGTPALSSRSFVTSGIRLNASTTLAAEGGDDDDIDDFNGVTAQLNDETTTTTQVGDYIDTSLQMAVAVTYISSPNAYNAETISFNDPFNSTPGGTTNIKSITTTVTSGTYDAELETNIQLRAFSCNIGTYELKERNF